MRCGKRLSLIFAVLLLASFSLWAFPGRAKAVAVSPAIETAVQEETTAEEPIQEAEPQKMPSGTGSGAMPEEQLSSPTSSIAKAAEIADKGGLIIGEKQKELQMVIEMLESDISVAEEASKAKDEEIVKLRDDLAKAEGETGTKAYLMLDGIVGFEAGIPQFGAGITVGTRIGNSIMVELGADYMIGGMNGYNQFDIDNFQFRAGAGWMF